MCKKFRFILLLIIGITMLAACGADENDEEAESIPVPEELVEREDPLRIKDQLGLSIGETGWVIDWANRNILEITLNSVEITPEIGDQRPLGHNSEDNVFVIGNFTMKNHGEVGIPGQGFAYPDIVAGEDRDKIENDGFANAGELLGRGDTSIVIDEAMNKQPPTEPGEERTGNVVLNADYEVDTYIIYFGFEDYESKLTWEFDATEAN
ncbi:hypothetical protein NSQ77_00365 [Oceanobacillus sp. FSL K6-2867]|uniref:hypothetical protein n=1 Tax=Oceanobacillus sp. FSL K6-2867 TaxID=2954748 RepID=UPI0030DAC5C5